MILHTVVVKDTAVFLVGSDPKRGSHRKKGEKKCFNSTSGIDDNIVFLYMHSSPDLSQIFSQVVVLFIVEGDDLVDIRMMVI